MGDNWQVGSSEDGKWHYSMPVATKGYNQDGKWQYEVEISGQYREGVSILGVAEERGHKGIDIPVSNVPVYATEDRGVVRSIAQTDEQGQSVTISYERLSGDSYNVTYNHLDSVNVQYGDLVEAGMQVGVSGNSGVSAAPHLEICVEKNGRTIDPMEYLSDISERGGLDIHFKQESASQDQAPTPTLQNLQDEARTVLSSLREVETDQQETAQVGVTASTASSLAASNFMTEMNSSDGQEQDRSYGIGR